MTIYGYCCCSSADQNEARQLFAMSELNIPAERIYTDKVSGKDFERPSFQALLEKVESGDLIWVLSIDRLGRNYNVSGICTSTMFSISLEECEIELSGDDALEKLGSEI